MSTRVVLLSDTHGFHAGLRGCNAVPEGELLIHAGDLSLNGNFPQIVDFANWFNDLPHPNKVLIAGNHDWLFQNDLNLALSLFDKSIHYLQDSGVELCGFKIWGSPITPTFYNWAFNRDPGPDIQRHWDMIPLDTDILVTHGPEYGVLDQCMNGDVVGCKQLGKKIKEMKNLKLHVAGHIHFARGILKHKSGLISVNAAISKEDYRGLNRPIIIEI